jgi:hypothetical protein
MIVHMLVAMNGGRYDGQTWPPMRTDFEVPDEEGEALVRDGVAVKVADSAGPSLPPLPKAMVSEPSPTSAGPATERPPVELPPEAPPLPPPADDVPVPVPADPKSVWVAYAVSQGASQAEAESLTKNQLQSAYGGRLLCSR